jgi:Glycosyl transferase family 2
MSRIGAAFQALPGRSANAAGPVAPGHCGSGKEGTSPILRLHNRGDSIARDPLDEILGGFHDRAAARRFRQCTGSCAGYRWKPKLALVLPDHFNARRLTHRRDLSVALEIIASVIDQYNVEVVSNSPEVAGLFGTVTPYSPDAIAGCAGALVLLSRRLNEAVASICPSRYVAADPCAFLSGEQRIAFETGSVEPPFVPVDDREVVDRARRSAAVLLDDGDDAATFVDALKRLHGSGVPLTVVLSARADDEFDAWARAAFGDLADVVVRHPEPQDLADRDAVLISNDPLSLMTGSGSKGERLLFRHGAFGRIDEPRQLRSSFFLIRGEEASAYRLLGTWLKRREIDYEANVAKGALGDVEPLVSIVVPVRDETTEILRLARSIHAQDYPWIEIVFVASDGPADTLAALNAAENYLMTRRFRVRVIELNQAYAAGSSPADFGIRAASGDLICLLAAHDWLDEGFFSFIGQGPLRADTIYDPRRAYRDPTRVTGYGAELEHPLAADDLLTSFCAISRSSGAPSRSYSSGVCFSRTLFDRARGTDHRLSDREALDSWPKSPELHARREEHAGRVNIVIDNETAAQLLRDDSRPAEAGESTTAKEPTQCP